MNYHNVTPPEYYAPWDNGMARHQLLAQTQLRELAPRAALGLAVSAFNEVGVAPGRLPAHGRRAARRHRPHRPARRRHGRQPGGTPAHASGARWVSVGRLAPNKAIELAVMALLVARAHDDPAATLQVVGPSGRCRPTRRRCTASSTTWACTTPSCSRGALSDAALAAAVAEADVFVLTSRHEGFGVPVMEAMTLGVPVVANEAGALPEVVGDGGLLVDAERSLCAGGGRASRRAARGRGMRARSTPSTSPRRRQGRISALSTRS